MHTYGRLTYFNKTSSKQCG